VNRLLLRLHAVAIVLVGRITVGGVSPFASPFRFVQAVDLEELDQFALRLTQVERRQET